MLTVSVSGLADLLAVLPYQLGFHPRDSLVAVVLHDRRIGMVARVDLPGPAGVGDVVAMLLPPLAREEPDGVLLVGYEDVAGDSAPLLDGLTEALGEAGIPLTDAAVVRGDRWYAVTCHDPGCCPPEGRPVPEASAVPGVAAFVAAEVVPLGGRDELAGLVAEDPLLTDGVAARVGRIRDRTAAGRPVRRPGRAWGRVLCLADDAPAVAELPVSEVAAAVCSLHDLAWRDGLIAWAAPGSLPLDLLDGTTVGLLRRSIRRPEGALGENARLAARLLGLCRRVPDSCPDEAAHVCALTAAVLWSQGQGALANVAVDRALRVSPGHSLARLIETMLALAVRPSSAAGRAGPVRAGPQG